MDGGGGGGDGSGGGGGGCDGGGEVGGGGYDGGDGGGDGNGGVGGGFDGGGGGTSLCLGLKPESARAGASEQQTVSRGGPDHQHRGTWRPSFPSSSCTSTCSCSEPACSAGQAGLDRS